MASGAAVGERPPPALARRPVDAHQEQALATLLACIVVATIATVPGVLLGVAVAAGIWYLTRPPELWRWVVAALGIATVATLQSTVQWWWPWRIWWSDQFQSVFGVPPLHSVSGSSLAIEALLGPMVIQCVVETAKLRSRTPRQQLENAHYKRHRSPSPPLAEHGDTAWVPAKPQPPTVHPPGKIRLGVDATSSRPFDLDPYELSRHTFLVGTTGSGKTVTLSRMADGALGLNCGAIFLDCKGGGLGAIARRLAAQHAIPYRVVDPDDRATLGYNPATGDPASVANTLVGSFTFEGAAEIYKHVAIRAVAIIVRALQAARKPVTLQAIHDALGKGGLAKLARDAGDPYRAQLAGLEEGGMAGERGLSGFQQRLGALLEGKFGPLFQMEDALDWDAATMSPSVTYLALSATASSEDVNLVARVYAQHLKQLVARRIRAASNGVALQPVLCVIDEFTVVEAAQVRDLILQSREALMPLIVATQYAPKDDALRDACLGVGLLVVHRLDSANAELLAAQWGTEVAYKLTAQVGLADAVSEMGSIREVEEYVLHPNEIRRMPDGVAAVRSMTTRRHAAVRVALPT